MRNVFDLLDLIRAEEHRCSIQPGGSRRQNGSIPNTHCTRFFVPLNITRRHFQGVIVSGCSFYSMRKQPLTALELFLLQLLVPLDPVTFTRNKILARLRLHYIGWSQRSRNIRDNPTRRSTPSPLLVSRRAAIR